MSVDGGNYFAWTYYDHIQSEVDSSEVLDLISRVGMIVYRRLGNKYTTKIAIYNICMYVFWPKEPQTYKRID